MQPGISGIPKFIKLMEGKLPDFNDTQIAFAIRGNEELKKMAWLFRWMANPTLTKWLGKLGSWAIKNHLPFAKDIVLSTLFYHFCGGRTLLEAEKAIHDLKSFGVNTILDYGAEGKSKEEELNFTMNELLRAIDFSSNQKGIPAIGVKLTGLVRNSVLENISQNQWDIHGESAQSIPYYQNFLKRIDAICHAAAEKNIRVAIDAEESWMQWAIDEVVTWMMERYNKNGVVVYHTFQMYRTDRLDYLLSSLERAQTLGYYLGAKLVRGAYMDKERERALEFGYPSPIQPDKEATDQAFDSAVLFCLKNRDRVAVINASHNANSCYLQAKYMLEHQISTRNEDIAFSQLFGMSDNLTFGLAKAQFNASKYVPYGQVKEVIPYLVRRAEENNSVTGDLSRELAMIQAEIKRRRI
jgi:proline dehydrogenase